MAMESGLILPVSFSRECWRLVPNLLIHTLSVTYLRALLTNNTRDRKKSEGQIQTFGMIC